MKLATKIFLSLLATLVVILAAVTVWQYNYIKELDTSNGRKIEEIEIKKQENSTLKKEVEAAVSISFEEDQGSSVNHIEPVTEEAAYAKRANERKLTDLIDQIYNLEAFYSKEIEQLVISAKDEYHALPTKEQTDINKWKIVLKYIGSATKMEWNCDRQMAEILGEMETLLIKAGSDLDLIKQVQTIYKNEKEIKRNYYLSLYV